MNFFKRAVKNISIAGVVCFGSISNSFANASFESSEVEKIILHDWGGILVYLKGEIKTTENCDNKGSLYLAASNQHYDKMYAALLAAYHSGTKISGWVNGCNNPFKKPVLTRLDLMPKSSN